MQVVVAEGEKYFCVSVCVPARSVTQCFLLTRVVQIRPRTFEVCITVCCRFFNVADLIFKADIKFPRREVNVYFLKSYNEAKK